MFIYFNMYVIHKIHIKIDKHLIEKYTKLNNTYHFKVSMKDEFQNNLQFLACQIREELSAFGYSEIEVSDMLVKYLYEKKNRKAKELLWFCYGKCIVENLKHNYPIKKTKAVQCIDCEEWFEADIYSKSCRCKNCQHEYKKMKERERKRKNK